ncbi:MAG: DUF815 domain-containing protein [Thermoleophilia bacterium]
MSQRVAYADLDDDPLISALSAPAADAEAVVVLDRLRFELPDGVAAAMADRVLASTGPFARSCRRGIAMDPARLGVAEAELRELGRLAHAWEASEEPRPADPRVTPPACAALRARMAGAGHWGELAAELAAFHRGEGAGALATHRVLRFADGALSGVDRPDGFAAADLVGGEDRREPLAASLTAFVAGRPANDALLYGPPGTGKSVTVRALAEANGPRGLRLIRLERPDPEDVRGVFAAVAGAGPRCLLLLDDLVFDAHDRTDRALRAALEGDVAERPPNVLVWATTNRPGLVRDTASEREDDIDQSFGRVEKSALATRFGLRVAFPMLDRDEYLEVAMGLMRRMGLPHGAEQEEAAMRFARRGHGLTPRTARQFTVEWGVRA